MPNVQQHRYCWRILTLLQRWVAQHQIQPRRRRKLTRRPQRLWVSSNCMLLPGYKSVKEKFDYAVMLEIFVYLFVCADVESSIPDTVDDPSARTTLIICPLSVLSNWLVGIQSHTTKHINSAQSHNSINIQFRAETVSWLSDLTFSRRLICSYSNVRTLCFSFSCRTENWKYLVLDLWLDKKGHLNIASRAFQQTNW